MTTFLNMKKIFTLINLILVLLLSFAILYHPNTSLDQDLGRHIKIGEIIVQTKQIPITNLFTYTNTDFPFSNHHWLSEVVFYLFNAEFGILSISFLKIFILLAVLVIIMYLSSKIADVNSALIGFTLYIPLFMSRTDERPEIFGILFFSFLLLIYLYLIKKNKNWLFVVPIIQMLWVNMHITFIYGYLLIVILTIVNYQKNRQHSRLLILIFGISILLGLINPQFFDGLIYPLKVFSNYGYSIVENQNLFYLANLTSNIFIKYFWAISLTGWAFIIFAIYKKWCNADLTYILLYSVFFLVSLQMLRNFPFFSIVGIICMSYFLHKLFLQKHLNSSLVSIILMLILGFYNYQIVSDNFYQTFDINKKFKVEVKDSYRKATNFILKNDLRGPIFNNFDIGGYLDYALYPKIKTYVDNRPEAFPVNFFDEYKKQYELKEIKEIFNKYKINTIVYSHTDGTGWASEFLKQIKNLPEYKMIYFDANVVMFEKNSRLKTITDADFEKTIKDTKDSHDLMNIYRYLWLIDKRQIAPLALEKAYENNPKSCQIQLQYGYQLASTDNLFQRSIARNIFKDIWFCPFPNEIKNEIANL